MLFLFAYLGFGTGRLIALLEENRVLKTTNKEAQTYKELDQKEYILFCSCYLCFWPLIKFLLSFQNIELKLQNRNSNQIFSF
jgi:hypothetical protein